MKRSVIMVLMFSLALYSCKDGAGKEAEKGTATEKEAEKPASEKTAKTPIYTVNEADWVETDLSKISAVFPVTLKLPKTAVLEKFEDDGIIVKINDNYQFMISKMSASDGSGMKETVAFEKDGFSSNDSYIDKKIIKDEPNGFVYTRTMKEDEYSKKYDYTYDPEAHFFYALEKGKVYYTVADDQSPSAGLDMIHSEDTALKAYDIIKNSMKIKG